MISFKFRYAALYGVGIGFLIFGNRDLWERIREENKQEEANKKMAVEAAIASRKPFEVQELAFDPATSTWKNNEPYFQTIHVGKVNFKALRRSSGSRVETNDDEDASDTF